MHFNQCFYYIFSLDNSMLDVFLHVYCICSFYIKQVVFLYHCNGMAVHERLCILSFLLLLFTPRLLFLLLLLLIIYKDRQVQKWDTCFSWNVISFSDERFFWKIITEDRRSISVI